MWLSKSIYRLKLYKDEMEKASEVFTNHTATSEILSELIAPPQKNLWLAPVPNNPSFPSP